MSKIDDFAKQAFSGIVSSVIDQFQKDALKQITELEEKQLNELVEAEIKAYCESLNDYAAKSDSWWVKIRNRFLVSIISSSTDAIITAVKETINKFATEEIDKLQSKLVKNLEPKK